MPENSRDLAASGQNSISGRDLFGCYTSEVQELLSEDDGLLPFPHQISRSAGNLHEVGRVKGSTKNNCRTKENNAIIGSASLFSNGVGAQLSDSKKERLKSLLRQSVFTLTQEVDEMINPVLSVCRIQSCLRCKESLLSSDAITCEADQPQHPHKKCKQSPECLELGSEHRHLNGSLLNSDLQDGRGTAKLDDDLRFILENYSPKVDELMESHSNEIAATLHHMEHKLEELLNNLMSSCRAMTVAEKQQLRKLIQKLPPRNLDRVAEIIEHNEPSENYSSDLVHVDLDQVDNVTLWRLYFYVATIQAISTT